jgi:hypothetical protein
MIFVSCYGHKKIFEDGVPRETIVAFRRLTGAVLLKTLVNRKRAFTISGSNI